MCLDKRFQGFHVALSDVGSICELLYYFYNLHNQERTQFISHENTSHVKYNIVHSINIHNLGCIRKQVTDAIE